MNLLNIISVSAIPVLIAFIFIYSSNKCDAFSAFVEGAEEGLRTSASILPSLILLMTAVGMLKSSGALDCITSVLSPLTDFMGIPPDAAALAVIRPISGSGALAVFENILKEHGADSFTGLVASVIMGSTETTFYTMAVYFSCTRVKNTRATLPAALTADFTGFVMSALAVRLLLGA